MTRAQVVKLDSNIAREGNSLDIVGYADDTTNVTRQTTGVRKRELTYQVYEDWKHKIHPDKWQTLVASQDGLPKPRRMTGKRPRAKLVDKAVSEAKVLGCYLEADGGYRRERGHRISRASMV